MDTTREHRQKMLQTPWVSSWFGRARPGDRYDTDGDRRAAAWAHWAVGALSEMTGAQERSYPALVLEGKFHANGQSASALVRPHLEIPSRVLSAPDSMFPDRVAQMGNALAFPYWIVPEVTAVRRALFNVPGGDISGVVGALNARRGALDAAVATLAAQAAPAWDMVEELLVGDPDALEAITCGDISTDEVASFLPVARDHDLSIRFDAKLIETSRGPVSRRLGVWQLHGSDSTGMRFALGVVTPRLTANSQFHDTHFAIAKESPAALLVRGLLLRRLLERVIGQGSSTSVAETAGTPTTYLRSSLAQVGQKLPEASVRGAVQFLQAYPDPDSAWQVLEEWAGRTGTLLTVREEQFREAHRRALRFVRRAEEPERDDVNVILPLGWDEKSRVVRVVFSKRSA